MIQVDGPTLSAIRRLSLLALAAGWVVFAFVGHDSQVFLVVMVVLSMIVGSGIAAVLRRRDGT
jgi:hypothetical protein